MNELDSSLVNYSPVAEAEAILASAAQSIKYAPAQAPFIEQDLSCERTVSVDSSEFYQLGTAPLLLSGVIHEAVEPQPHLLWSINRPDYELTKPVEVLVERIKDGYIFYCSDFGVSGMGVTKEEAIKDLASFIVNDFSVYSKLTPQQLSPEASRLLVLYQSFLKAKTK